MPRSSLQRLLGPAALIVALAPHLAHAASVELELRPVATGLPFATVVANAGDASGRLFVAQRAGATRLVKDGQVLAQSFLDLTGQVSTTHSDQGLLGLVFHPQYATDGQLFVCCTDPVGTSVVSRFSVDPSDPDRADPTSEEVLLQVPQPHGFHNVGLTQWEEVSYEPASSAGGVNCGWRRMEGAHCYPTDPCDTTGLTLPVFEFAHGSGRCAVIGGYLVHGTESPALAGLYPVADFRTGDLWSLRPDPPGGFEAAFGSGSLLITSWNTPDLGTSPPVRP